MDLYDLGRDGGEAHWLDKIAAPMLLVGIRTDWLYPPDAVCELAARQWRLRARTPATSSSIRPTGTTPSSRSGIS